MHGNVEETELIHHLETADAVVVLHPLVGEEWSLFSSKKRLPQALQIVQPGAAFIAVNFKRLDLLSGDKLVVRDPNSSRSVTVTPANASDLVQELETSNRSPHSLLLRTHPLLIKGDGIVVEYFPSIPTLMLPKAPSQLDNPVVVLDSYAYVTYAAEVDTESTVGTRDEAKEAVCYRKTQPKMYAKARAVARLMIRTDQEKAAGSEQVTKWSFCTGWLIGRGNHLVTNHHCVKDAAAVEKSPQNVASRGFQFHAVSWFWPRRSERVVEAVVGFMVETKSCREKGFMGEKVGVVEATRVSVVVDNPRLDYALLRVHSNDSLANLTQRYGYLRLRAAGPVDGEAIYIPQHPRGEPKEIAAMKDGKLAVIEVQTPSSFESSGYLRRDNEPTVWYNADTEPGSSGSPVLSRRDNSVVALHRAGNSETTQSASTELFNTGVRIDLIARDLQRRRVLPPNALSS
ncbi:hypothetical protein V7S43_018123 [Phytophthora oleae]|uniref:Serine protease n=1 Tax=Phytophthora oleae TaxID=2107226 RepID=A0ABD3ER60_9STRA